MKDGKERVVHENYWRMHDDVSPEWPHGGVTLVIEGAPTMRIELPGTWLSDGLAPTAFHAVNAIPAVCAASPGIRTFLDLPLITGQNTMR